MIIFIEKKLLIQDHLGMMRRAVLPSSAFVTNAYEQSFMTSAQFGMYTTSQTGNGFDQSGSFPAGDGGDSDEQEAENDNNETTSDISTPTDTISPPVSSNVTETPTTETPAQETNDGEDSSVGDIVSGGFGFIKKRTNVDEPAGYLVLGMCCNHIMTCIVLFTSLFTQVALIRVSSRAIFTILIWLIAKPVVGMSQFPLFDLIRSC